MQSDSEHARSQTEHMAHQTEARYEFDIDLESDNTHARVIRLVGTDRRVVELGPATGYMSRALRARGCSVVGIEVDPAMAAEASQFCERVIVGDLDSLDLEAELGSDRFDVIVAADVLEHLKDPLAALRTLRGFLADDGFFVISLPNIAHGSVRLALLEGHFRYQKLGLLDETHLRFFTRETIEGLLDQAELGIAEIYEQKLNFDASEITFDATAVPAEVIQQLQRDPDARTYQFVIKAIPFATPGLRELQRRMRGLAGDVAQLRSDNEGLREDNERLREDNERLREPDPQVAELQEALAALVGREGQLRASLIDAHDQLLQRDETIAQQREQLLPLKRAVDSVKATLPGRIYLKLRRARRLAGAVRSRADRYRSALRRL